MSRKRVMPLDIGPLHVDAWRNKWAHSPFNAGRHHGGFTVLWKQYALDVRWLLPQEER